MNEFIKYEFVQNSIIAGLIISLLCSLLGVFVVQRKMSFLGSGISHSTLAGIGLALLFNIEPLIVAIPFTVIISFLITLLNEKTNIEIDSSIGILVSTATALGIIFIALKSGYSGDAYSYLFGSVLTVTQFDIYISLLFAVITVIIVKINWKKWAYITFDRELAASVGINIKKENNILSIILAFSIVISVKLIGIILISAFLIFPPATARLFSKTFAQMTIFSIIIGIFSTIFGLFCSFIVDLPSGATIIIAQTVILCFVLIFHRLKVSK